MYACMYKHIHTDKQSTLHISRCPEYFSIIETKIITIAYRASESPNFNAENTHKRSHICNN